jgi:hypothetical protein
MTLKNLPRLQTDVWTTYQILDAPASSVKIRAVEKPFEEPEKARQVREAYFLNEVLGGTQARLQSETPDNEYFIDDFEGAAEGGINQALYERSPDGTIKRLNFDGPNVNFSQVQSTKDGAEIDVFPIAYSEWMACQNPGYAEAYKEATGQIPNAGVGLSLAIKSKDDFFVLTQRGTGTPNYPGTLFTVGGGLKPQDSVVSGLLEEVAEEAGLTPGENFQSEDIILTAVGAERNCYGGRHDRAEVVGYLSTDATFEEIVTAQGKAEYQTDVSGLVPLTTGLEGFSSRVAVMGAKGELLPAAELGVTYAWLKHRENELGPEQAAQDADYLSRLLNKYEREIFTPPKLRD